MFQVNDRIVDAKGYKGTVRYIGSLPLENNKGLWYGIEWDDENRGKHNGSVINKENQCIQIFQCDEGKGSFVRENKISSGISLEEAILERYENPDSEGEESKEQGFKYKKIVDLETILLENNRVSYIRGDLHTLCPKLKTLNLSSNLISKTSFLQKLIEECPLLENLFMSRNPLLINDLDPNSESSSSLHVLSLAFCDLNWETLTSLSSLLKSVQSLYLHGNPLILFFEPPIFSSLTHLKLLDLSNCGLSDWKILQYLPSLKELESLNLSQNQLNDLQPGILSGPLESSVHDLDINHNNIQSMETLSLLFSLLPSLSSLLCLYTPLYNQNEDPLLVREEIIASFSSLLSLNNTKITSQERSESELYYVKQWLLRSMEQAKCKNYKEWTCLSEEKRTQFLSIYPRYSELVRIHGEPVIKENSMNQQNTILSNAIIIRFKYIKSNKEIKKKFPLRTTIKQVKQVICKLLKLESLKTVFYHIHDESIDVINCETDTLEDYNLKDGDELTVEENEEISYHI